MDRRLSFLLAPLFVLAMIGAAAAEGLRVLAAGSLSEVTTEIGELYKAGTGASVIAACGPSGVLRERIENGEPVDLFASADMGRPLRLVQQGRASQAAEVPPEITAGPEYGLAVLKDADPRARSGALHFVA